AIANPGLRASSLRSISGAPAYRTISSRGCARMAPRDNVWEGKALSVGGWTDGSGGRPVRWTQMRAGVILSGAKDRPEHASDARGSLVPPAPILRSAQDDTRALPD